MNKSWPLCPFGVHSLAKGDWRRKPFLYSAVTSYGKSCISCLQVWRWSSNQLRVKGGFGSRAAWAVLEAEGMGSGSAVQKQVSQA